LTEIKLKIQMVAEPVFFAITRWFNRRFLSTHDFRIQTRYELEITWHHSFKITWWSRHERKRLWFLLCKSYRHITFDHY